VWSCFDGHVVRRLDRPEPITDRPFRETNAMICFSTELLRHGRADSGDAPPLLRAEDADDDQDGLPNWFEMNWCGKFLDWSTASLCRPRRRSRRRRPDKSAGVSGPDGPDEATRARAGTVSA
jgi:hypothetical protein